MLRLCVHSISDDWMTFILSAPRANCARGNIEIAKWHIVIYIYIWMLQQSGVSVAKIKTIRNDIDCRLLENRIISEVL